MSRESRNTPGPSAKPPPWAGPTFHGQGKKGLALPQAQKKLEQPQAWLPPRPHLRNETEDRAPQESTSHIMGGAFLFPLQW